MIRKLLVPATLLAIIAASAWAQSISPPTTGGSSGGAPSGAAGGDLGGTYPNPTVQQIQGGAYGTNVVTALKTAVGSAGGPVVNGGALGTPSSGNGTNLTPINPAALIGGTVPNAALGVAPTSWTPTDQSGAGLSFTAVSANYVRMGNIVFAYGTLTYPGTADASNTAIGGLPVATANAEYARQCNVTWTSESTANRLRPLLNSTTMIIYTNAGAAVTNATMSGDTITFMCIYPAT